MDIVSEWSTVQIAGITGAGVGLVMLVCVVCIVLRLRRKGPESKAEQRKRITKAYAAARAKMSHPMHMMSMKKFRQLGRFVPHEEARQQVSYGTPRQH